MDVQELRPGLWQWTTPHHEWLEVVGSVYYEAPDAVVLIDPLVPEDEAERFWKALDRDVKRAGLPVHVLITVFWHARSAREVAARYDGRIWAYRRARVPIRNRAGEPTDVFAPGDALPGGIEALESGRPNEVLFWIPEHRAVVVGDVLLGDGEGGLATCPAGWLGEKMTLDDLKATLRPLLDLPVELVIPSHGPRSGARSSRAPRPVVENARERLASALR